LKSPSSKINVKLQKEECDAYVWMPFPEVVDLITGDEKEILNSVVKCRSAYNNEAIEVPYGAFQGVYPNLLAEGIGLGHILAAKAYYKDIYKQRVKG